MTLTDIEIESRLRSLTDSVNSSINSHTELLDKYSWHILVAMCVYFILYLAIPYSILNNILLKCVAVFFLVYMTSKKNATLALLSVGALILVTILWKKYKYENFEPSDDSSSDLYQRISTEDGKLVLSEAKRAMENGLVHPAEVDLLALKLFESESKGKPILVANTEEGIGRISEIEDAESNGLIDSMRAKELVAKIVVQENVLSSRGEATNQGDTQNIVDSESADCPTCNTMPHSSSSSVQHNDINADNHANVDF